MKKILILGGAGFIGSHLCKRLIELNEVICMDNLSSGNYDNIQPLIQHPHFTFIEQDIENEFDIKVDEMYQLASPASPVYYQLDPIKTSTTNVIGSLNALRLATKYNSKILLASTSEIYGDPLEHPQTETYFGNVNSIGIRACYDESKRMAESLFMDFHRQFQTRIKIARIFNTYGPHMGINDGRVISNFMVQAIHHSPITLYGDGMQTRSFCFVDDMVEGLIKLMESHDEITGPFNLGNPEEVTMKALAEKIVLLTKSTSNFTYFPKPLDDPIKRKPNIDKAKQILNWEPKVSLEKGLFESMKHYKEIS
jgi:UDP-glucuronate decarboxylase